MYKTTIAPFIQLLNQVNCYVDKAHQHAELKKYDPNILLQSRLSPDQYPLIKQLQVTCDAAKGAAARLSGKTPPVHEDTEKTFPEIRTRIEKTVSYLKTFKETDFNGWQERHVDIFFLPGKYLNGFEYLTQLAVPNFYFHLMTAYSILRHNGVDVGKMDFLGPIHFLDKK